MVNKSIILIITIGLGEGVLATSSPALLVSSDFDMVEDAIRNAGAETDASRL